MVYKNYTILLTITIFAILAPITVNANVSNFRLGLTISSTAPGARGISNRGLVNGIDFWKQWIIKQPPLIINNNTVQLQFSLLEDGGNATLMKSFYSQMVNDPTIDFLLGPVNSDFSLLIRSIVDGKKNMLETSATAEGCYKDSQSIWSQLTPSSRYMTAALLEMKLAGASTVSSIYETHPYTLGACNGAIAYAHKLGMTVVNSVAVPPSLGVVSPQQIEQYRTAMDNISKYEQDVILICSFLAK